jgi:hypothetical protein
MKMGTRRTQKEAWGCETKGARRGGGEEKREGARKDQCGRLEGLEGGVSLKRTDFWFKSTNVPKNNEVG